MLRGRVVVWQYGMVWYGMVRYQRTEEVEAMRKINDVLAPMNCQIDRCETFPICFGRQFCPSTLLVQLEGTCPPYRDLYHMNGSGMGVGVMVKWVYDVLYRPKMRAGSDWSAARFGSFGAID